MGIKLSAHQMDYMAARGIPERMHHALKLYFEKRIPPGGFLTAVLDNDLMGAYGRADEENMFCIRSYVMWLYNDAPSGGHGYTGAVKEWCRPQDNDEQDA